MADDRSEEQHSDAVAVTGHDHGAVERLKMSPRTVRVTWAIIVPAAVAVIVAMVVLWPWHLPAADTGGDAPRAAGEVLEVHRVACQAPDPNVPDAGVPGATVDCGTVEVRVIDGVGRGQRVTTDIPAGPGAPTVHRGDRVVLIITDDELAGPGYHIIDRDRGTQLWVLVLCFAAAVIAFGRWRGLSALAGLAVTFGILLYFVVPSILAGRPPLLVAIVGSAAIMLSVLYLTHGINAPTSMAVLGTLASLCLTGLLSQLATAATSLTGVAGEDSQFLTIMYHNVDMRGLLLAGILIGSLGVLDDVAVTQAFTVAELAGANRSLGFAQLYRAASRVGRAHIASVVNTIVLAYAGASLPLLLLLTAANQPIGELLTNQNMAQEIVRAAVGTIGLIAAVPITTALAAFTASRNHARPVIEAPPAIGIRPTTTDGPAAAVPRPNTWSWDEPHGDEPW